MVVPIFTIVRVTKKLVRQVDERVSDHGDPEYQKRARGEGSGELRAVLFNCGKKLVSKGTGKGKKGRRMQQEEEQPALAAGAQHPQHYSSTGAAQLVPQPYGGRF